MAVLTLQSCLHDDKEIFDEPASERLQKAVNETRELLESADNGWVFHYYNGEEYTGSGWTFLVKFKNGKAYVSADFAPSDMVTTSSYDIVQDQGPVLSFDTFNDIMHFLAQPYIDDVDGLQGDYEFVVMNTSENVINLRGRKWKNDMTLTRLPEGTDWQEYLESIDNYGTNMVRKYSAVVNGTKVADLQFDTERRRVTVKKGEEFYQMPYCANPDGVTLALPLEEVGNGTAQDFALADDDISLQCVSEGDKDVKLEAVLDPDYIISILGSSFGFNDEAGTKTYRVNHTDNFTFTSLADWMTVDVADNTITITTKENNEGHVRSGQIKLENENGTNYIEVVQADFDKDVAGNYYLNFKDWDRQDVSLRVNISRNADDIIMQFYYGDYLMSTPLVWDEQSHALVWYSGQFLGIAASYYIHNIFLTASETYWSGTSQEIEYAAQMNYDEATGTTSGAFSGEILGEPIGIVYLEACYGTPLASDNMSGRVLDVLRNPVLVKANVAGAKPTATERNIQMKTVGTKSTPVSPEAIKK